MKDKRQKIRDLFSNNVVSKRCEDCNSKMVPNVKKEGWLICPSCANEFSVYGIKGIEKLVDKDAGKPILFKVGHEREETLEEKEIKELEKAGMKVKSVKRVS